MMKLFIFDRITDPIRRRISRKLCSIADLPAATSNMIRKGKHVRKSDFSDSEFSLGLKGMFIELESVYQHTRIKKGVAISLDYKRLAGGSNNEGDRQSAVVSSFSSNSSKDLEAAANMANLPDEVLKRLEKQEQRVKQQEESSEEMKKLLIELLARTKKDRSILFIYIQSTGRKTTCEQR